MRRRERHLQRHALECELVAADSLEREVPTLIVRTARLSVVPSFGGAPAASSASFRLLDIRSPMSRWHPYTSCQHYKPFAILTSRSCRGHGWGVGGRPLLRPAREPHPRGADKSAVAPRPARTGAWVESHIGDEHRTGPTAAPGPSPCPGGRGPGRPHRRVGRWLGRGLPNGRPSRGGRAARARHARVGTASCCSPWNGETG